MNDGELPNGCRIDRLGILGGTFDPVHNGHIAVARAAMAEKLLDRVLLTPSGAPPHKSAVAASSEHRLEMVRLAVEEFPGLVPSDLEIRRQGTSYTVDTLELLHERHPDAFLYFIIGADSVAELPSWRAVPRIFELAQILTLPRQDAAPPARFDTNVFPDIPKSILDRCEQNRLTMAKVPITSTRLRESIARGESFDDAVPAGVARYIRQHRLYGWRSD